MITGLVLYAWALMVATCCIRAHVPEAWPRHQECVQSPQEGDGGVRLEE